jgi:hypothetical protein
MRFPGRAGENSWREIENRRKERSEESRISNSWFPRLAHSRAERICMVKYHANRLGQQSSVGTGCRLDFADAGPMLCNMRNPGTS